MKRIAASLALILACWAAASTAAAETIELRLFTDRPVNELTLLAPGWRVTDGQGRSTGAARCAVSLAGSRRGFRCDAGLLEQPPFTLAKSESGAAESVILIVDGERRRYPGRLRFEAAGDRLQPRLTLATEEYVVGVLAAETVESEAEYLKAMAICIRGYLRYRQTDVQAPLPDNTRGQMFRGLPDSPRAELLARLTRETVGLTPRVAGRPAPVFYHACCGGHTRAVGEVWPTLAAWAHLRGVNDTDVESRIWCRDSKWSAWQRNVPAPAWRAFLHGEFGAAHARRVSDEGPVSLTADAGSREIGAWKFRMQLGRVLGWNSAPSDRFVIVERDTETILNGHGFGHRVGLCQAGALAQARAGKTAEEILRFYFPGVEIK